MIQDYKKVSPAGRALVEDFEKCRLVAYKPTPNDVWTIGIGHTEGVRAGQVITQEQAIELLIEDMEWVEECVNKYVRVPINQNQFDALACFVFNVGCGAFKGSTLLKKLNNKDYEGAANQFIRWNKQAGEVLAGLTRRRFAEAKLFNSTGVA